MAVFKNFSDDELIISCKCGCDEGIHFAVGHHGNEEYYFMTFISGNFYREQKCSFVEKMKKIWAIIRNKDYCYSDICMSRYDFEQFKNWVVSKSKNSENADENIMKIKNIIWNQSLTDIECIEEIQRVLGLRK